MSRVMNLRQYDLLPLEEIVLSPALTIEKVAAICERYTSDKGEVYARVEFVNGKAVAYLVRQPPDESIPLFLRKQAL